MRLALSSAAAPDATLDELLTACTRRGISALEPETGHGHGLDPSSWTARGVASVRARAEAAGVQITAVRLAPGTVVGRNELSAFSRAIGAPVLVPVPILLEMAGAGGDGSLVAVLPSGAGALAALADLDRMDGSGDAAGEPALAWDLDPAVGDVSAGAGEVFARAAGRLRHVQLLGGGPEAAAHDGKGVGSVMARLTLAGFTGTVALAPSSPRFRVVWNHWLGRRGGWGCGSKQADKDLVSLEMA
jgi:hypothetical protein